MLEIRSERLVGKNCGRADEKSGGYRSMEDGCQEMGAPTEQKVLVIVLKVKHADS